MQGGDFLTEVAAFFWFQKKNTIGVIQLTATYGSRIGVTGKTPLPPPHAFCAQPLPPEKVCNDRSPLCLNCPYPRHGLSCHNKDSESCLRADMQELESKWRDEWPKRKALDFLTHK